jgi:hypothetical protein
MEGFHIIDGLYASQEAAERALDIIRADNPTFTTAYHGSIEAGMAGWCIVEPCEPRKVAVPA